MTAESLTNYIISKLEQLGISLQNCSGQGYNNSANMRVEKSGVQKSILEIYPLAYFLAGGSHSSNLILEDAASLCVQAKKFWFASKVVHHVCRLKSGVGYFKSSCKIVIDKTADNTTD